MTTKNTLWSIKSVWQTNYLLGSVHFLREEDHPLSDEIESAFNQSSAIVFESNLFEVSPEEVASLVSALGHYQDGTLLTDNLGSETNKILGQKATELQLDIDQLSTLKPWLLTFILNLIVSNKAVFDEKYGIDKMLGARAKLDQKEMLYLETVEEQFVFLDKLPTDVQEALLQKTLTSWRDIAKTFHAIANAWKTGDLLSLDTLLLDFSRCHPEAEKSLIVQRNQNWLPSIERHINTTRTTLVVVGAAHLVGGHGLLQMFEEKGYVLKQL